MRGRLRRGPSAAARMAIRGRALRLVQARGPCATARTGQEGAKYPTPPLVRPWLGQYRINFSLQSRSQEQFYHNIKEN